MFLFNFLAILILFLRKTRRSPVRFNICHLGIIVLFENLDFQTFFHPYLQYLHAFWAMWPFLIILWLNKVCMWPYKLYEKFSVGKNSLSTHLIILSAYFFLHHH